MNFLKKWLEGIRKRKQEQQEFYDFMRRCLIVDYGCGARIWELIHHLHGDYERYGITNLNIETNFYDYSYTITFYWNKIKFYGEGYCGENIVKKYHLPDILHDDYWVLSLNLYYDGFQITDIKKKRDIVDVFVNSVREAQANVITEADAYINSITSKKEEGTDSGQ